MSNAGRSALMKGRSLAREQLKKCWLAGAVFTLIVVMLGSVAGFGTWSIPLGLVAGGLAWWLVYRSLDFTVARRWIQGGLAEQRTGRVLKPLTREGWWFSYDMALPGTRANMDALGLHPSGSFGLNLDTKAWHASGAPVRLVGTTLMYGPWDQTGTIKTITNESKRAARALGIPVVSVIVLDKGRVDRRVHPDGVIHIPGSSTAPAFYVIEQGNVVSVLRTIPGDPDVHQVRRISGLVDERMPAYREKKPARKR